MSQFKKYMQIINELKVNKEIDFKVQKIAIKNNVIKIKQVGDIETTNYEAYDYFRRKILRFNEVIDEIIDKEAKILEYDFNDFLPKTDLCIFIIKSRRDQIVSMQPKEEGEFDLTLYYYMNIEGDEYNSISDEYAFYDVSMNHNEIDVSDMINDIEHKLNEKKNENAKKISQFLKSSTAQNDMKKKLIEILSSESQSNYLRTERDIPGDYEDDHDR
jgi:hypothetical protein